MTGEWLDDTCAVVQPVVLILLGNQLVLVQEEDNTDICGTSGCTVILSNNRAVVDGTSDETKIKSVCPLSGGDI